jgi:hypothetical protein
VDAAARHLVEHRCEGGEEGAAAVLDGGARRAVLIKGLNDVAVEG